MAAPHLLVRDMAAGEAGDVGVLPLSNPGGARAVTDLPCARLYMAAGNGICLSDHGDILNPYKAIFFGPDFKERSEKSLPGVPSRARVSSDGKYGSSTVFVTGDSYAAGAFSTRTTIWDLATGNELVNLEEFTAWNNGKQLQSADFNFWGVTFDPTNSSHFYATLGTKGHTYLVSGDLAAKKVSILRDGVECPSVSPDGTRIAFKQRTGAGGADLPTWRLAVLDLATLHDHPLAETHNVDDQPEWLDNSTVAYAVDTGVGAPNIYATAADGSGTPRLLVTDADSPSVAR
jgi:WD40 repeat protein